MSTLTLAVVLGLLGAATAIGLAYAWAAVAGTSVSGDELARHALLSFVVAAGVTGALRRRPRA